jgi:Family of unknown function (DUF6318)
MSTVPARARLGAAYSPAVRDLRGSGAVRGAVVGLLLATALLSGCAEKQEARDTLPTASAAPTTEALPELGPADFPVPDEARTKDAAGAEAFLRYYIELINRQRAIPAGQPLRDLGPECQTCSRIARNYDDAAQAGYRYVGGELSINDSTPARLEADKATMNFAVRQEAVQRVDSAGASVDAGQPEAPNVYSGIALIYSDADETWLVEAFDLG